ncbi:MAG: sugar transferase [Bacteroidetes bacterium]|nr:sugar transferase [Fibrella sp.]
MLSANPSYSSSSYSTERESEGVIAVGQAQSRVKRLFDFATAILVILLILSWLTPLVALAIWLTSPGPVLFIQLRTGRYGQPFRCFKFRTMTYNPAAAFKQATKNDTRVTRIGHFLRRTNLDEMPQFVNVLLGDMTVVGPRPHAVQMDAHYWHTLHGYPDRYRVRPGITGLAQVRGCRGETDTVQKMKHRLRLDHFYIQKQSIRLDVRICWWTVIRVIKGDEKAH